MIPGFAALAGGAGGAASQPIASGANSGPITVGGLTVPPYPGGPVFSLDTNPSTKILLITAGVLVAALVVGRLKK